MNRPAPPYHFPWAEHAANCHGRLPIQSRPQDSRAQRRLLPAFPICYGVTFFRPSNYMRRQRDKSSVSTAGHCCRVKRLSPARILRALRRARSLCVWPQSKSPLAASWALSTRYAFAPVSSRCPPPHSLGDAPHRCLPPFNLHRARVVRRNRGRLPSNGFIERAQSTVPALRLRQNARPIKH